MFTQLLPAIRATIVLAILTGIIFPFLVTLIAKAIFPFQANGSLIYDQQNKCIGSILIGQSFTAQRYFHARPSAAGSGYAAQMSSGTNLGPTSQKLIEGQLDDPTTKNVDESFLGIKQLVVSYRLENILAPTSKVPVDAVTRSGSGLDPHISIANALLQAKRISIARSLSLDTVLNLILKQTEDRQFGILGEPRINVLRLNLALDNLKK